MSVNVKTTVDVEITLKVEYDYQKAERATSTYPGCGEDSELVSVTLNGRELLDILTEQEKNKISEACLERFE